MFVWDVKTWTCVYSFDNFKSSISKVCFSPDSKQIVIAIENEVRIYTLDYELHFPGWADFDDGVRPYLDIFLTLHPDWTDDDFDNIFIPDLQNRGYGWLRPEGVRAELKKAKREKAELKKITRKNSSFLKWISETITRKTTP